MGATDFTASSDIEDIAEAFRDCKQRAQHEYGHGGYTGSIAEKNSWVIIRNEPMDDEDAMERATDLIDSGHHAISDKWGPAGAIKLNKGWLFFGWASS